MGKKRVRSNATPENNRDDKRRAAVSTKEKSPSTPSAPSTTNNTQHSETMNNQSNNNQFSTPVNGSYVHYANGQSFASPQLPTAQASQPNNQGSQYCTPAYNTPPTYLNLTGNDQFSTLLSRLDVIDSKLSQLDGIQKSVKSINSRLDKIDTKVTSLESKIIDVEKSREFDSSSIDEINHKQKEIETLLEKVNSLEQQQRNHNEKLEKDVIDLKSRSMRDNLLFFGIPEVKNETDSDCVQKVLTLIEAKCNIENATTDIKLHRAHRIGGFNMDKMRPIVAKFVYFPDRERVRRSADTLIYPQGISQQFPQEVVKTRKRLYPIMKAAREKNQEAHFVLDRLYIDRKLYREPTAREETH